MAKDHPAPHPLDGANPDEAWARAVRWAEAQGITEAAIAADFQQRAGISHDEASAGELLAFLDELENPPYRFTPAPEGEGWLRVTGGALSQPVDVRLAFSRGRPQVVGVRVDNDKEVRADTLREIRVGRILQDFLSGWTPTGPNLSRVKFKEHQVAWEGWLEFDEFLRSHLSELDDDSPARAKRGTPPNDETLRRFAQTYLRQLATRPHGALTEAARQIPIARSTAYRWAELCRERGYLPTEGES